MASAPQTQATDTVLDEPGGGQLHPHVVPLRLLLSVFAALILLTVATVGATRLDLGGLNIWIALAIAMAKAGLVAEIFMHLRWDRPLNRILLFSAGIFVVLFIGIALLDSHAYAPDLIPGYAPGTTQ
jgi:cytochrome c oxidase subunit 4